MICNLKFALLLLSLHVLEPVHLQLAGPTDSEPAQLINQQPTTTTPQDQPVLSNQPGGSNGEQLQQQQQPAELQELENFRRSPFYVAPFDERVLSIPKMQRQLVRDSLKSDHELFREILREAIEKRNKMAPSVQLMFKYTPKLLGRMLKNRQAEYALPEHFSYSPEFIRMFIGIMETIVKRSDELKGSQNYKKDTIDTKELTRRVDELLNWVQNAVNLSPMAAYLKWPEAVMFKERQTNSGLLVDEMADLYAQFRALGYEGTTFVARRIISLLNMFSRNLIPSLKDVSR